MVDLLEWFSIHNSVTTAESSSHIICKYRQVLKIWDLEILRCFFCFPHSGRFAAKLVLFKTRKKFEIPLCYDFCKMFIEKRISQLSLILSCNSSFIFKIINHSNLIKSRWNEILFCFTLKNKGTTNASTIAIILQPCKLRYLLIIGILPLFSTAHKDEWWIFFFCC